MPKVNVTRDQLEKLAFLHSSEIVLSHHNGTARTHVGTTEFWCNLDEIAEAW